MSFKDLPTSHWAYSYIEKLVKLQIIGGYPDGSFRPSANVTRSEFAKMTALANGWALVNPATPSFSDVPRSFWAYRYIETAKARGAISGYPGGLFKPGANITRAEIAAIAVKAEGFSLISSGSGFKDVSPGYWAYAYLITAQREGIVGGYPDGSFKPSGSATRAEGAKIVVGTLD